MFLLILVIGDQTLYKTELNQGDTITAGSGPKDKWAIKELQPSQLRFSVRSDGRLVVGGKKIDDLMTEPIPSDGIGRIISYNLRLGISFSERAEDTDKTFQLPYSGLVSIGRSDKNTIVIKNHLISGRQLLIRCENGVAHLEDGYQGKPSTNGTYLNGKRITKTLLQSGDVIDILNVRITRKNNNLLFENTGRVLTIHEMAETYDTNQKVISHNAHFRRSPRIREQLPKNPIVLSKPPTKARKFEKRGGLFGQLIGSGAMVASSLVYGAASPALLAARGASLVPTFVNMASARKANKAGFKNYEEYERYRQEKYGAYIEAQKAAIEAVAEKQRQIINSEFLAASSNIGTVFDMKRTLWDRRPIDNDFLDVRIGMGYDDLCVEVKAPLDFNAFQMEDDEQEELVKSIIEETRIVDNVPARLHLFQYSVFGLIGSRNKVVGLLRNILINLTTQHFYEDVRIVGIFDEEERPLWEQLRWLPHVWTADYQKRYIAFDQDEAETISDLFRDFFKTRATEKGGKPSGDAHYIFILGSHRMCERLSVMETLMNGRKALGVTTILAYNLPNYRSDQQISFLPPECQFIVDTDGEYGAIAYDVGKINERFIFTPDPVVTPETFDTFCRSMSAIEVDSASAVAPLPNGITFLQGMNVQEPEQLDVWSKWQNHSGEKSLAAPMARMLGEKDFELDVVKHGPHGLIAGTTGSGKSELITAWLLSVAVHYPPSDVSFVIIDYKGGGLADTLEGLPHMVGKITNIGSNINRSMESLDAESKRRQAIFHEVGVNNIKDYIKGYHEGKYDEPLPRLLIVTDEFAELKAQEPDFLQSLISVARIGRSLGVHLVLACQNPSGIVDDQIRSNSQFQICLKVQSPAASKEVISHPDAAYISLSGRAYVRVGTDEIYEQVQSYWCGAPYQKNGHSTPDAGNTVRLVKLNGDRVKTISEEKTRFQSEETELTVISDYLSRTAKEHGVPKMMCPWLPELPENLYLEDLEEKDYFNGEAWPDGSNWLSVPVGRYDLPVRQEQGELSIDLGETGHMAIYGVAGSGKTTLMKTILLNLARFYTPKDVIMYLIDMGSYSLNTFEGIPHVGGVALSTQEEKFKKLATMLQNMFEERKMEFSRHGISSLKSYRKTVSADMPAVVLAVDNIVPIFESYPEYEGLLTKIAMEGASFGIYLIYTANTPTGIRFKITQNIRCVVAFEMIDKNDYVQLVGRVENPRAVAGYKGRAIINREGVPVVFQSLLYEKGDDESERVNALREERARMNQAWTGKKPERIPVMPDRVTIDEMLIEYTEDRKLPLGYSVSEIKPIVWDLDKTGCGVVTGMMGTGKSALLTSIAKMCMQKDDSRQLFVIDSASKSLAEIENIATGYCRESDLEQIKSMLVVILQQMIEREKVKTADENASFQLLLMIVDDIPRLADILGESDEKAYMQFRNIAKNAEKLQVMVIGAGRMTDLEKKSMTDPAISYLLQGQNAIVLSGSPIPYSFLTNNLDHGDKTSAVGAGYAWQ